MDNAVDKAKVNKMTIPEKNIFQAGDNGYLHTATKVALYLPECPWHFPALYFSQNIENDWFYYFMKKLTFFIRFFIVVTLA